MPEPNGVSEQGDEQLRPCGISIDAEGEWYHGENRIIRPEILDLLYDRIDLAPCGGYTISDRDGKCLLEVADVPFVVSRVDMKKSGAAGEHIALELKHIAQTEILDPRTLRVGENNVLYCRVRKGRFPARFSRPAYYQIAEFITETPGGDFCIAIDGIKYPISESSGE